MDFSENTHNKKQQEKNIQKENKKKKEKPDCSLQEEKQINI